MEFLTVLLLGIALSMDAFAVSLCCGTNLHEKKFKTAVLIGFYFGLFQALMPLAGFKFGYMLEDMISAFDHWVAFGLLSIIGGKMLFEGIKTDPACKKSINVTKFSVVIALAVATSIDALIAGLSLAYMNMNIYTAISIIGITTFIFSYFGVYLGERFSYKLGNKAEIIGGIILILIGIKTLFEHLGIITL